MGDPEARRAAGRRPKAEGGGRGGAKSCPKSRSQEIRWEPSGERRWPKPRAGEAIPNQGKREVEAGFLGQMIGAIQSSQRPNLALSFLKEIHQSTSGAFALAREEGRAHTTVRKAYSFVTAQVRRQTARPSPDWIHVPSRSGGDGAADRPGPSPLALGTPTLKGGSVGLGRI